MMIREKTSARTLQVMKAMFAVWEEELSERLLRKCVRRTAPTIYNNQMKNHRITNIHYIAKSIGTPF